MRKFIKCLEADLLINGDGTMDCVWLTPFIGDLSEEEYERLGTALSIRRGCFWCYAKFEFELRMQTEGWRDTRIVAHAEHPDWPGEWVSVQEIVDRDNNLVGYGLQWKLYKSLHEAQADGWKYQFAYYDAGKDILDREAQQL